MFEAFSHAMIGIKTNLKMRKVLTFFAIFFGSAVGLEISLKMAACSK